jgi:hypothetical protein
MNIAKAVATEYSPDLDSVVESYSGRRWERGEVRDPLASRVYSALLSTNWFHGRTRAAELEEALVTWEPRVSFSTGAV